MAELSTKERLQPSLLDRLTDHEPEQKTESRETRVITESQLRECVRRDLTWLFNTTHLATQVDLQAFPEVARSVLNFGIPDLAGRTLTSVQSEVIERAVRQAIWNFEPRLTRRSLQIKVSADPNKVGSNALVFDIEAELWAQPIPLSLFLRTTVDLEDGTVEVRSGGGM